MIKGCKRQRTLYANKRFNTTRKLRSRRPVPSLHGKYMGKQWKQRQTLFSWAPKITAYGDCSHEIKRHLLLGRKAMTNLDNILKSREITLPTKVRLVKAMVFPEVMYGWEMDYKESWAPKNWCFWTVVLEKTLESPLDCKEIQPVHPEGDKSWVFIGRTDAEAETPMLWPLDAKNWLPEKTLMLEKTKAGGEGDDRGWNGWMASSTQWMWVWGSSRSWWWTGKPGVLQSIGLQGVGHDWVTELIIRKYNNYIYVPNDIIKIHNAKTDRIKGRKSSMIIGVFNIPLQ